VLLADTLGHETRDGLATARLIERSSGGPHSRRAVRRQSSSRPRAADVMEAIAKSAAQMTAFGAMHEPNVMSGSGSAVS
jgi:hypothetical protein